MAELKSELIVKPLLEDNEPINNIKDMWNAAIKHYKDGDFDTDAIYDIHDRMDARLTFQNIADVIGAVYVDTYWNGIFLDSTIFAKNLRQSLRLDYDLALQYANNSFSQWKGILVRKNFSDSGVIPASDDYTASVDVVCNQNTPVPSTDLLINGWNDQFWKTPQIDKNYVYVRCQNLGFKGAISNARIKLFYTDGGFNSKPSTWIQLETAATKSKTGNILLLGGETGDMNEGDRGVSEAFIFTPGSKDHVCIIGVITSEFFTKNDPLVLTSNWDSVSWIKHNGAAGWHNVDPQKSNKSTLKFYNQDGRPEKFAFEAHCKNVPEGTVVALNFRDSKLQNANSGTVKISSKYQKVATETIVPANYTGDLEVLINTPDGKLLPKNASVEVCMLWILDHTHD